MARKQEAAPFTGFGLGTFPKSQPDGSVYILVVSRDGSLTAAAYATERGAMEAAASYLQDEQDDDEQSGGLEDRFAHAQRVITDEGGGMEIIASPVH